jgi:tripeptide aminopeptidase
MVDRDRLVREFMELVRIDSETGQEREISRVLQQKLSDLGLQVVEDDSAGRSGHGSGNLIATLEAAEGCAEAPVIYFTSHMDTVAPGKGIKPRLDKDGYIRSDGTTILGSDDKAGLAAMLEAIRVMREKHLPHGVIRFVITAGEESGLMGARSMDPQWLKASFGYALDSTGPVGDIAVAAPAQAKIHITFKGRSAHAGVNPEDGISAIQVASRAISRMPLGRIDKETTANIGSFSGGGATNIVCERAELVAEARSLQREKLDRQLEAMRRACQEAAREAGAGVEFESERIYPEFRFDETAPVVQTAMNALRKIGRTPRLFHTGGGSDANIFNGMGIPTVNLAVGYEHIHTTKEQMPVTELVKTAEAVLQIAREAAGR